MIHFISVAQSRTRESFYKNDPARPSAGALSFICLFLGKVNTTSHNPSVQKQRGGNVLSEPDRSVNNLLTVASVVGLVLAARPELTATLSLLFLKPDPSRRGKNQIFDL